MSDSSFKLKVANPECRLSATFIWRENTHFRMDSATYLIFFEIKFRENPHNEIVHRLSQSVKSLSNEMHHKTFIPNNDHLLKISEEGSNYKFFIDHGDSMTLPSQFTLQIPFKGESHYSLVNYVSEELLSRNNLQDCNHPSIKYIKFGVSHHIKNIEGSIKYEFR